MNLIIKLSSTALSGTLTVLLVLGLCRAWDAAKPLWTICLILAVSSAIFLLLLATAFIIDQDWRREE